MFGQQRSCWATPKACALLQYTESWQTNGKPYNMQLLLLLEFCSDLFVCVRTRCLQLLAGLNHHAAASTAADYVAKQHHFSGNSASTHMQLISVISGTSATVQLNSIFTGAHGSLTNSLHSPDAFSRRSNIRDKVCRRTITVQPVLAPAAAHGSCMRSAAAGRPQCIT